LPVAGDERRAGGGLRHQLSHPSTSRPGRRLPSRNSRLAPPPVETGPSCSSEKPSLRIAAPESPPPTTPRPSTRVSASATARVPAANAGNSNTPIGPFQNTVLDAATRSANAAAVSGPMSSPIPDAPNGVCSIASAGATTCSASAEKPEATTTSVGSTRSEEHTSELQSRENLVCRLLLEKKKQQTN